MQEVRTKIVTAVAVSVVIPLLLVIYLISRWAMGGLNSPSAIIVLTILGLLLIVGGVNIVRSLSPKASAESVSATDEPSEA